MLTCSNGNMSLCMTIPQLAVHRLSRTTGPNIVMFVLTLKYFSCWFQICWQYVTILIFFENFTKTFSSKCHVHSICRSHRESQVQQWMSTPFMVHDVENKVNRLSECFIHTMNMLYPWSNHMYTISVIKGRYHSYAVHL